MLVIDVIDQFNNKTRYQLEPGRYKIGKGNACDIILADPVVSREHAIIHYKDQVATLRDNNSTNGIFYQNTRLENELALKKGERIGIASFEIVVESIDSEAIAQKRKPRKAPPQESDAVTKLKTEIHTLILDHLDLRKRTNLQGMSAEELRIEADKATREVIDSHFRKIPTSISKERLIKEVVAEAVGLGALEPFLEDDSITEIMVNGPNQIVLERDGVLETSGNRFTSDRSLRGVIDRIVAPLGRRIDEGSPMVDARLPDGSRVNAIIPPLALNGPTLTIRKFAKKKLHIEDLIQLDTLDENMARFLKICVEHKRNIVISGGTGSGKTTTLNILSNFIDDGERIITIEDAAELQLNQHHVVSLESRPANAEGRGLVSIRELVVNALRMRPDRIVVGECRAGEALDMLQAMNTGHSGSMTTGHANTPRDFLSRLETMVMMAGTDLPSRAIREQISSAIDVIIQQNRLADGSRRITQIMEVTGLEGDTLLLQPLFEFKRTGLDEQGRIIGQYRGLGYAPNFYRELEEGGTGLPRNIFGSAPELSQYENQKEKMNDLAHGRQK